MESIRPHNEQIVGGFHWQETHTVHAHASGTIKQRHRGSHGRFQLNNRLARRIGGINGLFITNHWQRQYAVICGQLGLQSVNPHPDAVRVEIRVFFNVLSIVFVFWMHLTHFTQHQTARRLVTHDMAALAVGGSALGDFDHDRSAGIFEMLG